MSVTADSQLLPAYEMLWEVESDAILLLAQEGETSSAARYRGYKELDLQVGIGVFYPFDFKVSRVYLRRDWRSGPSGEGSHLYCAKTHPYATAYWRVEYLDVPKRFVDGVWKKAA